MKIIEQTDLSDIQKLRIIEMWNAEYPLEIAHSGLESFDEYLDNLRDKKHFLINDEAGKIVGWAMTFLRDEGKWFAIIVDGKCQGKGFGLKLLDKLKTTEDQLFGWVIDTDIYQKANGEKYRSPLRFYEKIGFAVEGSKLTKQNVTGVKILWSVPDEFFEKSPLEGI